jgi:hypothetical protein
VSVTQSPKNDIIRTGKFDFSDALKELKRGRALAIQREGWNGAGLLVKLQRPADMSDMSLPYLYIEYPLTSKTTPGAKCPWLASQTDMLADDWFVLVEEVSQ